MADNLWLGLHLAGLAANRPTAPTVDAGFVLYLATDTGVVSVFQNGAWSSPAIVGNATVDNAVTAATTQTLAAATQLTGTYSSLSVVANSGDAVKLPLAPTVGQQHLVTNAGANPAKVFPGEAGTTIDGGSAGASVTLTNVKSALFTCNAAGNWQSIGMATRSA